uniref:Xaa-Pro dipeptidase n=1 Tax=Attheya septentrionalis TaxID=420275 RepID=A0A7S2UNV8_9STRA|mmetsp:Transcript_3233/g.5867  ORF Transcript_3233/g.5867 Transcript_3233/m.5867 type:complete len:529 (+) Transcript_3233:42-1628(+)
MMDKSSTNGGAPMPFLNMGRDTYQVPVSLFETNRATVLEALKAQNVTDGWIYVNGGTSETRYDSDHEPLFRQESYFWYLWGVPDADCAGLISLQTGHAILLVPELPPDYATIMGRIRSPEEWKAKHGVNAVRYTNQLDQIIREGEESPKVHCLEGRNSDSDSLYKAPLETITSLMKHGFHVDTDILFPVVANSRVFKSEAELSLLRHVSELTSFAHAYVMRNTTPGMSEYQSESLFRHYCYYNYGCRLVGYTPICGCGPNAAILHYGHTGEPNARLIEDGQMCLYDMGAEYCGYGSDITCSFPVSGTFTPAQRIVYEGVLAAQVAVYDMAQPGVSFVDCHKRAELEILKALVKLDIVVPNGTPLEDLVEMRLGAVFMPHGLGHLIGIDTHDVGGYLEDCPPRIMQPGLKSLRTSRVLQEKMTLTVEPGCYFITHLIHEALDPSNSLSAYLNKDVLLNYIGFGGVRLEDVIEIIPGGVVNYTVCPRTVAEVEHVVQGGKWPPTQDEAPELCRTRLLSTHTSCLPSPPSI